MLYERFKNPPKEYSLVPLWFWNDELETENMKWQMKEMADKGIWETVISSRLGIQIPYLSELWFRRIEEAVKYGEELGMKIWLYDEDNWPSGYAGGRVLKENPDYCGKHLKRIEVTVTGSGWEKEIKLPIISAFKKGKILTKADPASEVFGKGTELLLFCQDDTHWNPAYSQGYYPDMLNREACDCFIRHTHAAYKERLSAYFGNVIKGFFVDEPGFYNNLHLRSMNDDGTITWTDGFPEYFMEHNGYDLLTYLPHLWEEIDKKTPKIRVDYYETMCDMYKSNFLDVLRDFCEENKMQLIGHLHYEEFMHYHIATQGNLMKALGSLSVTGLDRIDTSPEKISEKYISSAAHQNGKKRVMSETYALSGWELTIQDMKRWLDYQFVRGVNMLVPHAFYSSIEGERSRECPPSEFCQNPYWKYFRQFSQYAGRLSYILSQGRHSCHAALYYPIHAMQAVYTPQSNERVKEKDREFQKLAISLLEHQIDYDILTGESLLAGRFLNNGRIEIGEESYGTLIFSEDEYFDREIVQKVRAFVQNGGNVIFAGGLPDGFEGLESEKRVLVIPKNRKDRNFTYCRDIMPILHFLMKHNQLDLYLMERDPQIKYLHRVIEGRDIYFITNEGNTRKKIWADITGAYSVDEWNPETGETKRCPHEVKHYPKRYLAAAQNGGEWAVESSQTFTRCTLDLAGYGSCLLVLKREKASPAKSRTTVTWIPMEGIWDVLIAGENVKSPDLRLDALGQFYFSGTFQASIQIRIPGEAVYKRAYFAAERVRDCLEISVNGTDCGYRTFAPYKLDITGALHPGENTLTVKVTNTLLNQLRQLPQEGGLYGETGILLEN